MTVSSLDPQQEWEESILQPSLTRLPERREVFLTASGIPLERVYVPDTSDEDYLQRLGFPGQYPFTRGVQPTMYRARLWTMRQYAGFGSAEDSNRRYRFLLAQGQTGLSVAFDLPSQIGLDPDHPLAAGEVGRVGVSLFSLPEMERLVEGIPLGKVSTSMTINAPAAIMLALYVAAAKRQGAEVKRLRGTVQNDILKEYIARGTYIFPPAPSMRLVAEVIRYCHANLPEWNSISVSGYHIREAGSDAVQEVAFTLANGIAYVEAARQAGLAVDEFAPQLAFFFNAHNHLLEEIAKFRAARRMWARVMRERFGARDPRSLMLRFHAQTGGSTLTAQEPENNVVRVTVQALAAILGGAQSLHTNSLDEAHGLPSQHAVHLALRTQQVLAHESGVADTIDPLAGSYALEALTDEIERRALEYLHTIDEMGGALAAIERGYPQSQIEEAAYQAQRAIESSESLVVGVNAFADEPVAGGPPRVAIAPQPVDPALESGQRERLAQLRAARDCARAAELLARVEHAARTTEPLMPLFVEAVEAGTTVGELCGVLRAVWGEYRPA